MSLINSGSNFSFSALIENILSIGGTHRVTGLWGSSKSLFLSVLFNKTDNPLFVITHTQESAESLLTDLSLFPSWMKTTVPLFSLPFWEILPFDIMAPHPEIIHERMTAYRALLSGIRGIFVVPVQSLMQRVMSPDLFKEANININTGSQIERDSLVSHLVRFGYEPSDMVSTRGTFSLRGGIIDLFSPGEEAPVRIEFFGDTIDTIRTFDTETQRSVKQKDSTFIMPAKEFPISVNSLFDFLNPESTIIFNEPAEIRKNSNSNWNYILETYNEVVLQRRVIPEPPELYLTIEDISKSIETFHLKIDIEPLPIDGTTCIQVGSSTDIFIDSKKNASPIKTIIEKLAVLRKTFTVILVSPTEGQAERLHDILMEYDVPASLRKPEEIHPFIIKAGEHQIIPLIITYGNISSGFIYPESSLLIVTEEEMFGKRTKRRPPTKQKVRSFLTSFQDIKEGDYVVHVYHGVGQYEGLKRKVLSGGGSDFLCIRYSGGDYIYVPVDNLDMVQKYIGSEGHIPHIDRLQGSRWEKTKSRVQKAIDEIAADLLDLYAAREIMEGFSYSPDSFIMKEFETSFEYEETPDQFSAIEDVKQDMESKKPMDRLICGDVGYGKTEVALRAACKAILDGKQTAMLVPTTLLAYQHYQTFSQRFTSFPVRVEMLSRFRSPREQKNLIKDLADGNIDIIIGTQRLLQKDISFRNIGLVIVDEEQRFGVKQKEKLKQLRKTIDVLTLSATPIPRTLQLSLFGIRDLSIIETPPDDRLSIRTIIAPFDKRIIRDAILREFARDGRVFFVHNRVENIDSIAAFLHGLIPEARIGVAHGQMREGLLEDVMIKFISGDYNMLVCSAIIESGLDIPSANTIIINRADMFGLADLYQLRGRVGRSGHQAYAYFLIPSEDALTEDAKKRIKAIQELSELGAGFKLAIKDLEIRGSGNLLGKQQSGHISAVGFEMYSQMLEEAVKRVKGEKVEEEINPALNLRISAFIPEEFIEDSSQRLSFYKRLASVKEDGTLTSLREEMTDRYGRLPGEVENLFQVIEVKLLARSNKVLKIECGTEGIFFTIDSKAKIKGDILSTLTTTYPGRIRFVSDYTFLLLTSSNDPLYIFQETINCLKVIGGCV